MTFDDSASPFAVTMDCDPQEALAHVTEWLKRADDEHRLHWVVEDLETNGDRDERVSKSIGTTTSLDLLREFQVIELELVGRLGETVVCQIVIRDGRTLDLLGKGTPPPPSELGCGWTAVDPDLFLWK